MYCFWHTYLSTSEGVAGTAESAKERTRKSLNWRPLELTTPHSPWRLLVLTTPHSPWRPLELTTLHSPWRPLVLTTPHSPWRPLVLTTPHSLWRPFVLTTPHSPWRPLVLMSHKINHQIIRFMIFYGNLEPDKNKINSKIHAAKILFKVTKMILLTREFPHSDLLVDKT